MAAAAVSIAGRSLNSSVQSVPAPGSPPSSTPTPSSDLPISASPVRSLGSFSLPKMQSIQLPFGLTIGRDLCFEAEFSLSVYTARRSHHLQERPAARRRHGDIERTLMTRFRCRPRPTPFDETARRDHQSTVSLFDL